MNEIISTPFGGKTPATMSSREIAELTGKHHRHVLRDTETMLEVLGMAPEGYAQNWTHPQNGQTYREYLLPKDLTLTLVSGYDIQLRHRIVKRMEEIEAAIAPGGFRVPQTMSEALRLAADQTDRADKAEATLAIAQPKADALDRISASEGSMTFTQAAKLLGVKQDTMTRWMHANSWVYRQNGSWVAYSQHIQNGRLEYKEASYTDSSGIKCARPYCHITPKGLAKLATIFSQDLGEAA